MHSSSETQEGGDAGKLNCNQRLHLPVHPHSFPLRVWAGLTGMWVEKGREGEVGAHQETGQKGERV